MQLCSYENEHQDCRMFIFKFQRAVSEIAAKSRGKKTQPSFLVPRGFTAHLYVFIY